MKFMLLVYAEADAWDEEARKIAMKESIELCYELDSEGEYCSAAPLKPVTTSVSVRVRQGEALITDGPFAETTEQLAGYFLVDVENVEAAIAVARRIPGARVGTVEVRPVVELDNLPPAKS